MTNGNDAVRVASVGLSDYLRRYAFPGLSSSVNCEFVGVAGRDPAKIRTALGEQFTGTIYSSYEAAIESPDIDAIYITLPNCLHKEWSLRAVAAGKHVLCEKPLALRAADVDEIASAAKAANVVVLEALMYRHHPQWSYVAELLGAHAIGQVRSVVASYAYLDTSYTGPRFSPQLGGGALAMVGSYPIDTAVLAFSTMPTAATAFAQPAASTGVDGTTSAILEFATGHAIMTVSTEAYDNQHVRIVGSDGLIDIPVPINVPATSRASVIVQSPRYATSERADFGPSDQFKLQFEHFARVVRGLQPPLIPLDESRRYAEVIEAVARSARSDGIRIAVGASSTE